MAVGKEKSSNQPEPKKEQEQTTEKQNFGLDKFPPIGIGASAGGLEALSELFAKIPGDTGREDTPGNRRRYQPALGGKPVLSAIEKGISK
jgi:hypothetical protein